MALDDAINLLNQGSLPTSIAGGAAPVTAPVQQPVGQNTQPVNLPKIPAKTLAKVPEAQVYLAQQQEDDSYNKNQVQMDKQYGSDLDRVEKERKAASDDLIAAGEKGPKKVDMPENMAKHLNPEQLSNQYSAFMALGALAGLLTRAPMTAALNNMTAAINGVQKGDLDQFDKNFKEWQTNYKVATDKNKAYLEEYNRVMDNKKLTLDEKTAQLKLIDLKYQNNSMIALHSKQNYGDTIKAFEAIRKAQENADKQAYEWARLKFERDKAKEAHDKDKKEFEHAQALEKRFVGEATKIKNQQNTIQQLRQTLATGNPASDAEARILFTDLAGKGRMTNKELELGSNYGDLFDRMSGHLSKFFTGQRTSSQTSELLKDLDDLEKYVNEPALDKINKLYKQEAEYYRLPVRDILHTGEPLSEQAQPTTPTQSATLPPEEKRIVGVTEIAGHVWTGKDWEKKDGTD
jgi:hypothetical protein